MRHIDFNLIASFRVWLFFGTKRDIPHSLRRARHRADFVGLDVLMVDYCAVWSGSHRHN